MRKFVIIPLLFSVCMSANYDRFDTKEYDEVFDSIEKERVGTPKSAINKIQNPFNVSSVKTDPATGTQTSAEEVFLLNGIIQNRAKINGVWYKVGDIINEYNLVAIDGSSVTLFRKKDQKRVKITNGVQNVKIKIQ